MDLPSFLWLWKIAAWSMGLSLFVFSCLGLTGLGIFRARRSQTSYELWRGMHLALGFTLTILVLGLLAIGIVGTLGHYGNLGHSWHGPVGVTVVALTLTSAGVALQIQRGGTWARPLHLALNGLLGGAFIVVLWTGWVVVQKYLP